MALSVILNGHPRDFDQLESGAPLEALVQSLDLKPDRVAVEHNGQIAQRGSWSEVSVRSGDRLEIVHFVGGGSAK